MKKDIFISYSSKNKDIVASFLKDFKLSNISTWIDTENLYKNPGTDFTQEIMNSIDESKAVLLIYTKESMASEYVKKEIDYAFEKGKQVLCFPFFPHNEEVNFNRHRDFSDKLNSTQWLCTGQQLHHIPGLGEYVEGVQKANTLQSLITDLPDRDEDKFSVDVILARIGIQQVLGKPLMPFGTFTSIEPNPDVYENEHLIMKVINKAMYIAPTPAQAARMRSFLDRSAGWRGELAEINGMRMIDTSELMESMLAFIETQCGMTRVEALGILEEAKELATEVIAGDLQRNNLMFNGPMVGVYNIAVDRSPSEEASILLMDLYQSDYFTFKCTGELFHLLKKRGAKFDIKLQSVTPYAPFLCSLGLGGFIVVKHGEEEYLQWVKRSGVIQAKNMWHFSYDETVHLLKDIKRNQKKEIIRDDQGAFFLDANTIIRRALQEELRLQNKVSTKFNTGVFELGLIECDRLEMELLSFSIIETDASRDIHEQLSPYTDSAKDRIEREQIEYIPFDMKEMTQALHGKFLTPESYTLAQRLMVFKEEELF